MTTALVDRDRPRRIRLPLRLAVAAGSLVAVGLVATWAIHALALRDLPDVGHPFDVARDGTIEVPDARNAYVEYANAAGLLSRSGLLRRPEDLDAISKGGWSKASPEVTAWLEANRPALAAWRRGTDRPDAVLFQPKDYTIMTALRLVQDLREFGRLAALEGIRLESEGKMAEAWGWYRALLRSSRHVGRHGCLVERLVGVTLHGVAVDRMTIWAADPRVDATMLRRALDDVLAAGAMTAPPSDSLKVEYFAMMATLDDPNTPPSLVLSLSSGRSPRTFRGDTAGWAQDRFLNATAASKQEPERSRRVIRLVWANWLAYCDLPPSKRPPTTTELRLQEAPPDAPPAARTLTPEALQRWFDTTLYARALLPAYGRVEEALNRERSRQATLVLFLAEQLYRRDHGGQAPPSPGALVGPYLKALPGDH